MAKNELNVEDLVFNEEKSELDYLELPLSRQTFFLVAVGVISICLAVFGRLVFLNIFKGSSYRDRALANINKLVDLPAPRGIIFDRYGQQLVENKSSFSVFVNAAELLKSSGNLDETVGLLSKILNLDSGELKSKIVKSDLEKRNLVPLARNISVAQAIQIESLNLQAVDIENDYLRQYADGPVFSHLLGYVSASDKDQSLIGKSGLEAEYDETLRGQDGHLIIYRDAAGKPLDQKVDLTPEPGSKLTTTIDADLQRYFYQRLKNGLASLGRDSGVGIAMNPQTGEILSLISLPSFDNNQVAKFLNQSHQPLFNRAISGIYTPGSAVKPLVALAALKENIIDPKFQILSTGSIEIPNPYNPLHPSRFLDWKAHGWVDLHSAIARSSNVYFYEVGGGFGGLKGLGIERLKAYWQKFLLGQKTGIDLPAENTGFLPDPQEKEKRTGQIWRIGDTYNVSIGEGDLLLTPLQLINFISSIADGGKIHRPFLVQQNQPEILFDYSDWTGELREVQEGMKDTVRKPYGTANLLSSLPISAAGKTGSSQISNNTKTNAFFVGYAPAENPQIAVLVLIENSREGSLNAVPIAKDVFQWYYENRLSKR